MPTIIFGLSWKHPAVILNGISLLLDASYFFMKIGLNIPAGTHPYARGMIGCVIGVGLALWNISESSKANLFIGYVFTALNVFFGCIAGLNAMAYVLGQGSNFWHMLN